MTVTAPPRPSARADAVEVLREQALIKEARERARRRHQRHAAAAAIALAIVGTGALFAMRPDNGGTSPSATARPLAPAAPNAMRSTILFTSVVFRNGQDLTGTLLYSINADGTHLHRLLSGSQARRAGRWAYWPAFSPDGRQIAFQAGIESPRAPPAIDVVNRNGTGLHQIAAMGEHPSWSPDGGRIAYSNWPNGGIYVMRANGTARRRLTLGGGFFPAWSPDGRKIAYTCAPQGGVCVMNADGTGPHKLTSRGAPRGYADVPAWSPDSSKIAFLAGFPAMRIYVINANGTNLRRLAPPVSYKNRGCGPAWSPNGTQIAFSPTNPIMEGGIGGIYLMDADGRHVVHVKGTTGMTCGISWQRTPA